ncbi:hypothetical protein G7Z17_g6778 [Cylindrodendrum hubeiense]|uniref:Uncharacterized protein n=1 Tax=Cylindrodendrum hubeiense TaxID=595255 RepID=A0A9P5HCJ2_9HYPO|nr:hypothetical protein G7Z17_g6778 [Cylindrodendrum hubeiense]
MPVSQVNGELCVNGACTKIDIGSDPFNCSGQACDPGNWCLDGTCLPFILGSTTAPCETDDQCALGASCDNGVCRPFYIGTDSYNCGSSGVECSVGDLCVSDRCQPLNISTSSATCGQYESHPGTLCCGGNHFPIHISTDSSNCGDNGQVCAGAEVCVSGICVPGLEYTGEVSTVACARPDIKFAGPANDKAVNGNEDRPVNSNDEYPANSNDDRPANNNDDRPANSNEDGPANSDDRPAESSNASNYTQPPKGGDGIWRPGHSCPSGKVGACGLCLDVFGNGDAENCGKSGKACPGNQLCCRS